MEPIGIAVTDVIFLLFYSFKVWGEVGRCPGMDWSGCVRAGWEI